jgi:hypothetical protein
MARRGSPYGPAHQRLRKALIVPGAKCHVCGAQATELDHVPPLALHEHHEGSGCCVSLPACNACQRAQADALGRNRHGTTPPPPAPLIVAEPDDSPGPDAGIWRVPWLAPLLDLPETATWPRFMTAPHPDAVGSYGAEALEWLKREAGINLRHFQQLTLTRQLEHDADGLLVWLIVLLTTSRQVGKSVLLRGGATWRLHQADLFGEEQTIMHTGKDLPVCKEVQRLARQWAKARAYPVREQNGNEEITEPVSGSRWMVRGKDSVYGYAVSNGLVDEAWGVAPGVVEDGIEPTMAERHSPQLVLASTAHRRATSLFPGHRTAALEQLDEPTSTLLIEWSAPRDAEVDDVAAWRRASPHWSKGRERLLTQRAGRVRAGETLDPDEADPVESFRSQFLNIWPVRTSSGTGTPLVDPERWHALATSGAEPLRVWVGVADNLGRGAGVVAVADVGEGRYEVDGWTCADREAALESARRTIDVLGVPGRLCVEPSLATIAPSADKGAVADVRYGLPQLRELVESGRLVHDATPELDTQLAECRVRPVSGGLALATLARSDLVRAAALATRAAVVHSPAPAIH